MLSISHDIHRLTLKQAGAELCQAQVKLDLVVLNYDFSCTKKNWLNNFWLNKNC